MTGPTYDEIVRDALAAIDELPEGDPRIDEILYNLPPVPRVSADLAEAEAAFAGPSADVGAAWATVARIKALDLFAGTGWGVACRRLGIKEAGVEIMPEAIATRTANGMETIYHDVWDGIQLTAEQHRFLYGSYGLLIASPPCQTFSLAGKGAGRAALDEVLEAIELHAYKDADALLAFGRAHDMRTALVLTPLAYVWRDRPRLVAMEQVPTVLPVWEACAEVMREWGYEVKVEILNAEQYGVPQTRKRAILVARRGGPVAMPTPTHSRYYSRTPSKLDPGVRKWVSMAEALGWGAKDQPAHTITAGVHGPTDRWASGGNSVRKALDAKIGGPEWIDKPNQDVDSRTTYGQRFDVEDVAALQSYPTAVKNMGKGMVERYGDRPGRAGNQPAFAIRASAGGTEPGGFVLQAEDGTTRKLDVLEAAVLQSYPTDLVGFPRLSDGRDEIEVDGKLVRARDLRDAAHPAQTVTEKARSWKHYTADGAEPITAEQAAALQSYPTAGGWGFTDRPAMTVTGHGLVTRSPTGQKQAVLTAAEQGEFLFRPPYTAETAAKDDYVAREDGYLALSEKFHPAAVNCTTEENAVLQSYERPFVFCGTKTKQFLQIGNAVPPLLAEHVLAALVGIPAPSAMELTR